MLKGFKEFLMRGNIVDLAVAVVIGTSFTAVVKSFTDIIMDVIGKFGGIPDFSQESIYGIRVGAFFSAILAFLITATVVYFLVVLPLNKLASLGKKIEPEVSAPTVEELLAEILVELKAKNAPGTATSADPTPDA